MAMWLEWQCHTIQWQQKGDDTSVSGSLSSQYLMSQSASLLNKHPKPFIWLVHCPSLAAPVTAPWDSREHSNVGGTEVQSLPALSRQPPLFRLSSSSHPYWEYFPPPATPPLPMRPPHPNLRKMSPVLCPLLCFAWPLIAERASTVTLCSIKALISRQGFHSLGF